MKKPSWITGVLVFGLVAALGLVVLVGWTDVSGPTIEEVADRDTASVFNAINTNSVSRLNAADAVQFVPTGYELTDSSGSTIVQSDSVTGSAVALPQGTEAGSKLKVSGYLSSSESQSVKLRLLSNADTTVLNVGQGSVRLRNLQEQLVRTVYLDSGAQAFSLHVTGDTDKYRFSLEVLDSNNRWRGLVGYDSRSGDQLSFDTSVISVTTEEDQTTSSNPSSRSSAVTATESTPGTVDIAAQYSRGDVVATTANVNLRSGNSTATDSLGVMRANTIGLVKKTESNVDGQGYLWVKVAFVGLGEGWVPQRYLAASNRAALLAQIRNGLPDSSPGNPVEAPAPRKVVVDYSEDSDEATSNSGLLARYFDDSGIIGSRLITERVEGPVDFNSSRHPSQVERYMGRSLKIVWRGSLVVPEESGAAPNTYMVRFRSDGSHVIKIGDQEYSGVGTTVAKADLRSGRVPVEITYNSIVSNSNYARLEWAEPGSGSFELIGRKFLTTPMMSNSAPMVRIMSPEGDEVEVENNQLELRVRAADLEGEVRQLTIKRLGNDEVLWTQNNPKEVSDIVLQNMDPGQYYIQAVATDDEGMFGVSRSLQVSNGQVPSPEPGPEPEPNPTPDPVDVVHWSSEADWLSVGLSKPQAGDMVTIPQGVTVLLDESTPAFDGVLNQGTLIIEDRGTKTMTTRYLLNTGPGAELVIGEEDDKFNSNFTLTLTGSRSALDDPETPCGNKTLCATDGGKLSIHAAAPRPTWTKIGRTAIRGSGSIQLSETVQGWNVGDQIVITSTDFDPAQAEQRTITGINGRIITLDHPLNYMHFGSIQTIAGEQIDQRAEVMNLSRNVVVQGDAASDDEAFGAHTMVMNEHHHHMMMLAINEGVEFIDMIDEDEYPEFENDPDIFSHVEGVEFYRSGQQGVMARYPIHSHMYGYADGMTFANNSVHKSYQRCYTVHGTFDMRVENNVAYDAIGHCYFVEDGIEEGNVFENNIGALVKSYPDPDLELIEADEVPSVFWLANQNNDLVDNVAAGAYGNGFSYEPPVNPTGPSFTTRFLPQKAPVGRFEDNVAHSNTYSDSARLTDIDMRPDRAGSNGLWTDRLSCNRDNDVCEFGNFLAYKNGGAGTNNHRGQRHLLSDMILVDNQHGAIIEYINQSQLSDTLIVADTNNIGNPSTADEIAAGRSLPVWEPGRRDLFIGVSFHTDGLIKDSTFVGYQDNYYSTRAAISGRDSYERHPRWSENNILINSNPVFHTLARPNDSYTYQHLVKDVDGSLSGTNMYSEFRSAEHPIGIDNTCVRHRPADEINNYGYVCTSKSAKLVIDHPRFDNGDTSPDNDFIPLERDGQIYQVLRGYRADVFMPVGKEYEIKTPARNYSGMMVGMRNIFAGANYILKVPTVTELFSDRVNYGRVETVNSYSRLLSEDDSEFVLYHDGDFQYVKIQWVDNDTDFGEFPEKLEITLE